MLKISLDEAEGSHSNLTNVAATVNRQLLLDV